MKVVALFAHMMLALSAPASAAVLDFTGNICGGAACSNFASIDQSYGDTAQVDVEWDSDIASSALSNFSYWADSYSGLSDVGYADIGATGEIFFKPIAGFAVTITNFLIGSWPNSDRNTQVTVLDGLGNTLFSSGTIVISGGSPSSFGGFTSSNGIRIQFGPDAYDVGIDNIDYSVSPVSAVPLPASAVLLGGGLLSLFGIGRKRKQT